MLDIRLLVAIIRRIVVSWLILLFECCRPNWSSSKYRWSSSLSSWNTILSNWVL